MTTIRDKKGLFELAHQIAELDEPQTIWEHFLGGLCQVTRSHSSFLQQNDLSIDHPPLLISRGVDQRLIDQYLSYYYANDIWAGAIAAQTSPNFHNIQQLVDQKTYLSSELFNDLQKQQGSYYGAGVQLRIRNQIGVMLTFHRDKSQGAFDDDDMVLLNNLIPVLYETLWKMSDKQLLAQRSTQAFAYINSDLKIVEANKSFYDICTKSHEIKINDDHFSLCDTCKASELGDHIKHFFNARVAADISTDIEINLFDNNGNIEYGVILRPSFNQVTRFGFCIHGFCLRLEIKNYHYIQINWERIRNRFILTPSELSVLKLVYENFTRSEIACQRNSSPETIKSQVSSLEKKLGANNQTKIIRIIHSHSSFLEEESA